MAPNASAHGKGGASKVKGGLTAGGKNKPCDRPLTLVRGARTWCGGLESLLGCVDIRRSAKTFRLPEDFLVKPRSVRISFSPFAIWHIFTTVAERMNGFQYMYPA